MASSRLQSPVVDDYILLRVTHSNIKTFSSDLRFSSEMTVESVKEKLWKKCGTSVDSMQLELYDDAGIKVCVVDDNLRPLGFYSPQDGSHIDIFGKDNLLRCRALVSSAELCIFILLNPSSQFGNLSSTHFEYAWYRLHVIDLDPSSVTSGGWLEDTSLVEKYTISEEAYNNLDCNARKFKERMISQNATGHENKLSDSYMEDLCEKIKVGDRCEVDPGEKRGVIKFVGRAETVAPGFWVGIQLDEPLGKHDGMVKGKQYFQCPLRHGLLLRPDKVKVGDYPERDPFDEEEI